MRKCALTTFFAVASFAAVACVGGVTDNNGTVTNAETKRPIENVTIIITGNGLSSEQKIKTDARGNFKLPQLQPGNYKFKFRASDYEILEKTVTIKAQEAIKLNIELKQEEEVDAIKGWWNKYDLVYNSIVLE
jgi:hypothetical protein